MDNAVLPFLIAQIAEDKIGLHESGGANKGSQIQEFFDADDYDPNGTKPGDDGYPWCAAFVDRIVQLAMRESKRAFTFTRPLTPSAWGLEHWSRKQDHSTQTRNEPGNDIARGDIIIFKFSHCAIATSPPNADGFFQTVEGNTNVKGEREGTIVMRKHSRNIESVKCRIRFTV